MEGCVVLVQQGDDLTLGDADAEAEQLGQQAFGRDLALDVLHQHEAHHARADAEGRAKRSGANWPFTASATAR